MFIVRLVLGMSYFIFPIFPSVQSTDPEHPACVLVEQLVHGRNSTAVVKQLETSRNFFEEIVPYAVCVAGYRDYNVSEAVRFHVPVQLSSGSPSHWGRLFPNCAVPNIWCLADFINTADVVKKMCGPPFVRKLTCSVDQTNVTVFEPYKKDAFRVAMEYGWRPSSLMPDKDEVAKSADSHFENSISLLGWRDYAIILLASTSFILISVIVWRKFQTSSHTYVLREDPVINGRDPPKIFSNNIETDV